MNNTDPYTHHIYPFYKSWVIRFGLLYFPFIGVAWTIFGMLTFLPSLQKSFADSLGTTLSGFIFFVLMVLLYRALGQTRLLVTDDGMTYYSLGSRMYTPWKNVMRLERLRPYPFTILHARKLMGFKLRQKYTLGMTLEEGRQQQVAVLETDWWNPAWSMAPFADTFPLVEGIVGHNWQQGEFGQDLQHYAPWIFEQDPR